MAASQDALAYHEPGIKTILIQSCFLLALNWVNTLFDQLIYCGLVGQLLIGMVWGVPGANWLELDVQLVIQQLGYLGLLLLVYEGGLSMSFPQLKSNFLLSSMVAITGVSVPMALSFVLMRLVSATPLQAFAAGAALCSTSVGTTFTILSTTGLAKTRLGVVLGSAAMMDDVAGLVMVQIISNVGGVDQGSSFDPVVIVRPILVAIGFALGLLLICRFVVRAAVRKLQDHETNFHPWMKSSRFAFVAHMLYLVALVTGAQYAGTSGLFAAYLAGASISWLDETLATPTNTPGGESHTNKRPRSIPDGIQLQPRPAHNASSTQSVHSENNMAETPAMSEVTIQAKAATGEQTYEMFCKEPLRRILSPLFFASIGFSVPITRMFAGKVLWRGVVYTILMAFGKLITGIWLIRLAVFNPPSMERAKQTLLTFAALSAARLRKTKPRCDHDPSQVPPQSQTRQGDGLKQDDDHAASGQEAQKQDSHMLAVAAGGDYTGTRPSASRVNPPTLPSKPRSLYPASILGLAMIARGEIGYLIASLAETDGIFSSQSPTPGGTEDQQGTSEMYLVIVWAITLCTFIGPLCVGLLVKRVKTLQELRTRSSGDDPLGMWGVS